MADNNISLAPKIILNYNGGQDRTTGAEVVTKYVSYGASFTCPAPVSRGSAYSYVGWTRNSRAATPQKPCTFTATDGEYKMFCIWSHYDIILDYNGGVSAETGDSRREFLHWVRGTEFPLSASQSSVEPASRSGFRFLGWGEGKNASTLYTDSYPVWYDKTLYANWEEQTYTITVKLAGGTYNGSTADITLTKRGGSQLALPQPTRTGYNFLGYATENTPSGSVAFGPGEKYNFNAVHTLTAVWQLKTYAVTYDTDGGSGTFATQTKSYGTSLKLHSEKPVKRGYAFAGWSSDADPDVEYMPGATYTANAALSLKAIWNRVPAKLNGVAATQIGGYPTFTWTPDITTDYFTIAVSVKTWNDTTPDIYPGIITSYTFNALQLPMEICQVLDDAVSGTARAVLTTYDENGTLVGTSSQTFEVTVPSTEAPDFTYTLTDLNPNSLGLYIAGESVIQAEITTTPAEGTSVVSARLIVDGVATSGVVENDSVILTTGRVLTAEAVKTVTMEVTDSRGRSSTKTETITVWGYSDPTVGMMLEEENGTVTVTITGTVSPLNGLNLPTVSLGRSGKTGSVYDTEVEIPITEQPNTSSFTLTITDGISGLTGYTNFRYRATVTDARHTEETPHTASISADLWLGDRLTELSEDEIIIGYDTNITKATNTVFSDADGVLHVDASRCGLDKECLVGFPFLLTKEHRYQLEYDVDNKENAVVKISYFAQDSELTLIGTESVSSGSVITAPTHEYDSEAKVWAVVYFGVYRDDIDVIERIYSNISFRELLPTTIEEIPWLLETAVLGLDTPNHKYISKIQLRGAFDGVASVSIAYENADFMKVFSGKHESLRSFTIPINVRRCDHFRLKMEGVGQLQLYSMGYSTSEGSQWGA